MFKNNKCKYRNDILHSCGVMQRVSKDNAISIVTESDCLRCTKCSPAKSANRFTVCESLRRMHQANKFCIERHGMLVEAAKCSIGVGTILHSYFKWFATSDCGCEHRVKIMNEWGPIQCEESFEEIITWLRDASTIVAISFVELSTRALVKRCIKQSKLLYTEYDLFWILEL